MTELAFPACGQCQSAGCAACGFTGLRVVVEPSDGEMLDGTCSACGLLLRQHRAGQRQLTCEQAAGVARVELTAAWPVVGRVTSSKGDSEYEIRKSAAGELACGCPAWKFSGGAKPCKHLKTWTEDKGGSL